MWAQQAKSNRIIYEREKVKVSLFEFFKLLDLFAYSHITLGPCNAYWATEANQAYDSHHEAEETEPSENKCEARDAKYG